MKMIATIKKILFGLVFMFCQQNMEAKIRNLNVNFDGIIYDSLYVTGYDTRDNKIVIKGHKKTAHSWTFSIPDSAWNVLPQYSISTKLYNATDKTVGNIGFFCDNDTTVVRSILYFNEPELFINARFVKRRIDEGQIVVKPDGEDEFIGVQRYVRQDIFVVSCDNYKYHTLPYTYPNFAGELSDEKYSNTINQYAAIVETYPDSRYLLTELHRRCLRFKTKKDIATVFNKFSEQAKKTCWGKEINKYLTTNYFENMRLPLWNDTVMEFIVKDTTKFNLIIFSASWCAPCHKQIPVLKEIYRDLENNLEMINVSIDNSKTVENWRNLMIKEEIPWRSLLAVNDYEYVIDKYFIHGVPDILLVHPGGYMEKINEYDEKKLKDRIYKYFDSIGNSVE
jgi:thiol-disulfide isomerase/thioredoxin